MKVLHKLLETPEVSFIGLSNWNLDPAKMNRAIYLVRPETRSDDLISTASRIIRCQPQPLHPDQKRVGCDLYVPLVKV